MTHFLSTTWMIKCDCCISSSWVLPHNDKLGKLRQLTTSCVTQHNIRLWGFSFIIQWQSDMLNTFVCMLNVAVNVTSGRGCGSQIQHKCLELESKSLKKVWLVISEYSVPHNAKHLFYPKKVARISTFKRSTDPKHLIQQNYRSCCCESSLPATYAWRGSSSPHQP